MYSIVIAGLSYRKGLSWSRCKGCHEILCVHPLDLRSALAVVSNICELDATYVCRICNSYIVRVLYLLEFIACGFRWEFLDVTLFTFVPFCFLCLKVLYVLYWHIKLREVWVCFLVSFFLLGLDF